MDIDELKREIPNIFERVKRDVRKVLGKQRAGLTLGFVELGVSPRGFIGGMYFAGGTMILMNVAALRMLLDEVHSNPDKNEKILVGYVYHVMQHEYLHALGYLDEFVCREVVRHVTKKIFPEDHPVSVMARDGIGAYFPKALYATGSNVMDPAGLSIEIVKGFDKSSTGYFL